MCTCTMYFSLCTCTCMCHLHSKLNKDIWNVNYGSLSTSCSLLREREPRQLNGRPFHIEYLLAATSIGLAT